MRKMRGHHIGSLFNLGVVRLRRACRLARLPKFSDGLSTDDRVRTHFTYLPAAFGDEPGPAMRRALSGLCFEIDSMNIKMLTKILAVSLTAVAVLAGCSSTTGPNFNINTVQLGDVPKTVEGWDGGCGIG